VSETEEEIKKANKNATDADIKKILESAEV